MGLYINDDDKISMYSSPVIYLKNSSQTKITVPGKVVSVDTDNFSVRITTETNFAAFDTNDVAAILFTK